MIGKTVLVGLTLLDQQDAELSRTEVYGRITSADEDGFLEIARGDGRGIFRLPFDPKSLEPAAPGQYHLHTTGEVVDDPDFTTIWTVNLAEGQEQAELELHGFPD